MSSGSFARCEFSPQTSPLDFRVCVFLPRRLPLLSAILQFLLELLQHFPFLLELVSQNLLVRVQLLVLCLHAADYVPRLAKLIRNSRQSLLLFNIKYYYRLIEKI